MTNQIPSLANDLLRIHRAITRGLSVGLEKGAQYVQDGFPDPATRKGYTDYVQSLAIVLAAHHLAEDEIAFPAISEKLPGVPYGKLATDHQAIDTLVGPLRQAVAQAAAGEDAALPGLVNGLRSIHDLWAPHIHIEETHFTPAALAGVMPVEEQMRLSGAMAQHSQEHATPGFLALPFVLFNLNPEDRAAMTATMPAMLVEELIPKTWKDLWAAMKPFLLA
jgi:hemerythrin-like domain-containing protein